MKLYVIKARRMAVYLAALSAALLVLFAVNMGENNDALAVFSTRKEIPIYSVDVPEKMAAITFDCAWGAGDIPDILNTLEEADIKATFFLVGQWAEKHPDIVCLIAKDGHDIANHSYSHFRMGSLDKGKVSSEISQCGELLEKLTGTKCDLFRTPYGDYNNTVLAEARKLGYFTIQWDVDSLDWKPGIAKEEILRRIRSKIKPGSIILFHNDTPHTAKLLPDIISEMKTAGYRFVPVSKLIIRENYHIDHEGQQKNIT